MSFCSQYFLFRFNAALSKFNAKEFSNISAILESQNEPQDFVKGVGFINKILNENFGIIDMGKGEFALFDTYDLYLADNQTAADAGKNVDQCFQENQKVVANACLIDANLPLSHLATAVRITLYPQLVS